MTENIENNQVLELTDRDWKTFEDALNNPKAANETLASTIERYKSECKSKE